MHYYLTLTYFHDDAFIAFLNPWWSNLNFKLFIQTLQRLLVYWQHVADVQYFYTTIVSVEPTVYMGTYQMKSHITTGKTLIITIFSFFFFLGKQNCANNKKPFAANAKLHLQQEKNKNPCCIFDWQTGFLFVCPFLSRMKMKTKMPVEVTHLKCAPPAIQPHELGCKHKS